MPLFRRAKASDVPAITALINLAYEVENFFKIGDRTEEAERRAARRVGLSRPRGGPCHMIVMSKEL